MRVKSIGAVLVLGACSVALLPATTSSATVQTRFNVNRATGFCLDSNASKQAYARECNGGTYQQWKADTKVGAWGTMKNAATSFCLRADKANGATKGTLKMEGCNSSANQQWQRTSTGQWVNKAYGWCLDSDKDKHLYLLGCNTGSYQRWNLTTP